MSLQSPAHPVWREAFAAAQIVAGLQLSHGLVHHPAVPEVYLHLGNRSTHLSYSYFSCSTVLCLGKGSFGAAIHSSIQCGVQHHNWWMQMTSPGTNVILGCRWNLLMHPHRGWFLTVFFFFFGFLTWVAKQKLNVPFRTKLVVIVWICTQNVVLQGWYLTWEGTVMPNCLAKQHTRLLLWWPSCLSCVVLMDKLWPATPSALQLELAGGLRRFGLVCDCPWGHLFLGADVGEGGLFLCCWNTGLYLATSCWSSFRHSVSDQCCWSCSKF